MRRPLWITAIALAVTLATGQVGWATSSPMALRIEAPVTLHQQNPGYTPTVQIRVNDSEPLTVLLDSGSSGLVLNTPDVPQSVRSTLTDLSAPVSQDYTSGTVTGGLYSGTMKLLGADGSMVGSWTTPLMIGACQTSGCGWPRAGIQGVLGIASGVHDVSGATGTVPFASPFTTQAGVTGLAFHFDSARHVGTLTIGSTAGVSGTTLQAPPESSTYANGLTAYHHYVAGCWTVSADTSCDAYTTFDSGAPLGFISSPQFANRFTAKEAIPAGTEIAFSASAGAPAFGTLTVGSPNFELHYLPDQRSNPLSNNSGAGFLLDRDIAIDYAHGTVTIGALGTSVLPASVVTAQPSTGASASGWWTSVGHQPLAVVSVVAAGSLLVALVFVRAARRRHR